MMVMMMVMVMVMYPMIGPQRMEMDMRGTMLWWFWSMLMSYLLLPTLQMHLYNYSLSRTMLFYHVFCMLMHGQWFLLSLTDTPCLLLNATIAELFV